MLTFWLVVATASTAHADDTRALGNCVRAVEHCEADLAAAQAALGKANAATAAEARMNTDLARRLNLAVLERDEVRDGVRARATWVFGLGTGGTALAAAGIVLLAQEHAEPGAGLLAAGLLAGAVGYLLARK